MRIILDLWPQQVGALKEICQRDGLSRAEAIRRAVDLYVAQQRPASEDAFGIWQDRDIEGVEYQRKLRQEWNR